MAQDRWRELDVAVDLARRAGRVIMDHYHRDIAVEYKDKEEPVTAADRRANDIITAGLRQAFPGDGLLSEESDDDLQRLERERVWIVDPLDGTTEFIAETDEFVVQIALTWRGRPVLGVVYQPVTDLLYHGVAGQGAFAVQGGRCSPVHVSTVADPGRMCLVASRAHYSAFIQAARHRLGIEAMRQMGSVGLKVGLLARGACDLYLATNVCKEWDVCAPHALLLAAGGTLTNLWGAVPEYNQPEVGQCRGLLASNGGAHGRILEACAPLRDALEW